MTAPLRIRRVGAVLQLRLHAPQRKNALSRSMLDALASALTDLDDDIVGVVLAGHKGVFSAGADFADLTGTSADVTYDDAVTAVAAAITAAPVPVVAAVEGACIGAAAHLALTCDARIAGEHAYLQVPAVRLGLLYNPAAVEWLARTYPRDTVRRLLVLAERFDDYHALQAGLVSQVVPAGEAVKHATALLATADPEHRQATTLTKTLLTQLDSGTYDQDAWQLRRRELLDSPARKTAIERAQRRHLHHDDSER